ncbi:FMN-binding negative transcriptional regulator [Luteimonas salinilitoris]|uniref:FMN-binding negative transcriptional regulator n=1 Tax=Luteimonas salinilitoris TaxID=3237697 RepID=A0ABV4HU17_9GAMM
MHYAEFKHHDPALIKVLVEAFPFSAIIVNGNSGPAVALAPLSYRKGSSPSGAIEFHLALANDITPLMEVDTPVTVLIQGPGAAISPSWYDASFPTSGSDRSRTAPTYNYLSLALQGTLQHMSDEALQLQIGDLVKAHEPSQGWRLSELAPDLWSQWRELIRGYRFEVSRFDLTAKISQGDSSGDTAGVTAGLRDRALLDDIAMARLVEHYDGSATSLIAAVNALRTVKVTS